MTKTSVRPQTAKTTTKPPQGRPGTFGPKTPSVNTSTKSKLTRLGSGTDAIGKSKQTSDEHNNSFPHSTSFGSAKPSRRTETRKAPLPAAAKGGFFSTVKPLSISEQNTPKASGARHGSMTGRSVTSFVRNNKSAAELSSTFRSQPQRIMATTAS